MVVFCRRTLVADGMSRQNGRPVRRWLAVSGSRTTDRLPAVYATTNGNSGTNGSSLPRSQLRCLQDPEFDSGDVEVKEKQRSWKRSLGWSEELVLRAQAQKKRRRDQTWFPSARRAG
jgi:hypothetical protein